MASRRQPSLPVLGPCLQAVLKKCKPSWFLYTEKTLASSVSREYLSDDVPMNIGQTKVSTGVSKCEPLMVKAQDVQHSGV